MNRPGPIIRTVLAASLACAFITACTNDRDDPVSTTTSTTTAAGQTTTSVTQTMETTTTIPSATFSARVTAGKVTPTPSRHEVRRGTSVTIEVTSDVAEQIHVHGYDKSVDLAAGTAGRITFTADTPGVFEVELEHSHRKLLELLVR